MISDNQRELVVKRAAELVILNRLSHLDALELAMDEECVDDDVMIDDFVRPLEMRLEAAAKTKKTASKDPDAAALARATQAMDAIVRGLGPQKVEPEEDVQWISGTPPKSSSWSRTLDVMDMLDRRVEDAAVD